MPLFHATLRGLLLGGFGLLALVTLGESIDQILADPGLVDSPLRLLRICLVDAIPVAILVGIWHSIGRSQSLEGSLQSLIARIFSHLGVPLCARGKMVDD